MPRTVVVTVKLSYEDESGDTELVKRIGEDLHFARFEHGLFYVRGTELLSAEIEVKEEDGACVCKGLGWTPVYCPCETGQKQKNARRA